MRIILDISFVLLLSTESEVVMMQTDPHDFVYLALDTCDK